MCEGILAVQARGHKFKFPEHVQNVDVAVHACDPNTGEHRDRWVPGAHMPASIAQPNGELLFQ